MRKIDMETTNNTHRAVIHHVAIGLAFLIGLWGQPIAASLASTSQFTHLSIPILGLTVDPSHRPTGVVSYVVLHFQDRADQEGLRLRFDKTPGKFSPMAQHAVTLAIERVAAAANLGTHSWTVGLTFPYPGMTIYGESLSAMVGLSVVALAKGETPIYGRSITGTITEDGRIGTVGGVPKKSRGRIIASIECWFQRSMMLEMVIGPSPFSCTCLL